MKNFLVIILWMLHLTTIAQKITLNELSYQNATPDPKLANQIHFQHKVYSNKILTNNNFINGKEYKIYYNFSYSSPLFNNKIQIPGKLVFDNLTINDILLGYDMNLQKLLYSPKGRFYNNQYFIIELNDKRVKEFSIMVNSDSAHFKNLRFDSSQTFLDNGFYEIIYEGTGVTMICAHKTMNKLEMYGYNYMPIKNYYIKANSGWVSVRNRRTMLKALKAQKRPVKSYLTQTQFYFNNATKTQFIDILKYYESLL